MTEIIMFDIDGTLLLENNKYPNNSNMIKKLIKALQKEKYIVGVCTNRAKNLKLINVIKHYKINGPLLTEGGACVYKKTFYNYKLLNKNDSSSILRNILINAITDFLNKENINIKLKVGGTSTSKITLSKHRKKSSTIYIPLFMEEKLDNLIEYLHNYNGLENYVIDRDLFNKLKINVYQKTINKIKIMEDYFKNKSVVFITDYEPYPLTSHCNLVKIYSVGLNKEFNNYCDAVFPSNGVGVEKILDNIRRNL